MFVPKKILITGANGSIGQHFLNDTRIANYDITLLVRQKPEKAYKNVKIIEITDEFPQEAIKKLNPEIVLHFAGMTSFDASFKGINELIQANLTFGAQILASLDKCAYFINSASALELVNDKKTSVYSLTKGMFRHLLHFYAGQKNICVINAFLYNVYGTKSKKKKIIDYLLDGFRSSTPVGLTKGTQTLDFIHIDDITNGFFQILAQLPDFTHHTDLYLGSGKGFKLRQVAVIIERILGEKLNLNWGFLPFPAHQSMKSVANLDKNPSFFKWTPQIKLEAGLMKLLNHRQF
jgi:nucleoside-diphosphate-sugar epimerase